MFVKIKRMIGFALCVAMVSATIFTASASSQFADIHGHWAEAAITYAAERGYLGDLIDTNFYQITYENFYPDSPVSRAMFAMVFARLGGLNMNAKAEPSPFWDVSSSAYCAPAVAWAYRSGYMHGTQPNHFSPEEHITREQMFLILYRYAEKKGYNLSEVDSLSSYTDFQAVADYAASAVKWALKHGMYHLEYPNRLNAAAEATAAEMAFAMQAFDLNVVPQSVPSNQFTDISGHWAGEAITHVAEKGYFAGVSGTEFRPDGRMTRAMFVTVLARLAGAPVDEKVQPLPFLDVPVDAYYAPAVAWAYQSGYINGTQPDCFAPNQSINGTQVFVILHRYAANMGYDLSEVDNDSSYGLGEPYLRSAIKWALKHEMYHFQYANSVDIYWPCTRAEVAFALHAFDANVVPH